MKQAKEFFLRRISALLVILMVVVMLPLATPAAAAETAHQEEPAKLAVVSADNKAVQTQQNAANGLEYEVYSDYVAITGYTGNATALVIPSVIEGLPVTSIGSYAFNSCSSLTSITIPDSVTSIGYCAFFGCSSLKSITIPVGVTAIAPSTFCYCSSLTSITIPSSVTSIEYSAFFGCSSLKSITIPSSVTYIDSYAFCACSSLTSITIPSSVTYIDGSAFNGCSSLTKIEVNASNTAYTSHNGILYNNGMTTLIRCPEGKSGSITIPSSVTSIGRYAFCDCSRLTSITIPSSVTYIDGSAFFGCSSLTSITIPSSVTSIGYSAFEGCSSLTSVTIPSSVTYIDSYAFCDCSSLTSITIPSSVTYIDSSAFNGCSSLTKIEVNASNTAYTSHNGILYNNGMTTLIRCPEGKSGSFTIPSSVTSIGRYAFCDCSRLTSITIPSSVTYIDGSAFNGCSSLTKIEVNASNTAYTSHNGILYNNDMTELVCYPKGRKESITIPSSVTSIGSGAFSGCANLTSISIPNNVVEINPFAFSYCSNLTNVTFQGSLTFIGHNSFVGCSNLKKITLPANLEIISWYLFGGCSSLSEITIPKTVTNITYQAFYGCDSLSDVYYGGSKTQWDAISIGYSNEDLTNATLHTSNLKITKQPVNATNTEGKDVKVTVGASGSGLTYKWYYKDAGTSKFSLTTSFTGNTYQVTMNAARNGRQVYCVISDRCGNSVQTNTVTLKMAKPVTITLQPKTAVAATGTTAKVSVTATGDGLTYQWYFKNPGDSKFYLTNSFKGNSYSMTMDASRSGRQVYCVITDRYGNSVKTNTVTLKIGKPLTITKQSGNVTVAKGQTATAYVNASGEGLSFKWYYKNAGDSKFSLTTSFKSNTYSVAMDASRNGRQVYCVISDKYGNTVKTNTVTLKMAKPLTITKQSGDVTVAKGQTATAYVNVSGEGLSFKWYYKNPGDSKFSLTTSFKSNTYSVAMDASRNGRQVYCVISDKYGNTVKTNTVTLKMAKPLTITKQSGNVTVAKGQTATAYVNVSGEGLSFKWYYKNPGDSKFYLTTSFKSNTYSVTMDASRNGRQVYCVISDKYGNTVKTNIVSLKMK